MWESAYFNVIIFWTAFLETFLQLSPIGTADLREGTLKQEYFDRTAMHNFTMAGCNMLYPTKHTAFVLQGGRFSFTFRLNFCSHFLCNCQGFWKKCKDLFSFLKLNFNCFCFTRVATYQSRFHPNLKIEIIDTADSQMYKKCYKEMTAFISKYHTVMVKIELLPNMLFKVRLFSLNLWDIRQSPGLVELVGWTCIDVSRKS